MPLQRTGVWSLSSEGLESDSLESHVEALLGRLEPMASELGQLIAEQGLRPEFFCYWSTSTGIGGFELSPETLRRIAELGAKLSLDVYAL